METIFLQFSSNSLHLQRPHRLFIFALNQFHFTSFDSHFHQNVPLFWTILLLSSSIFLTLSNNSPIWIRLIQRYHRYICGHKALNTLLSKHRIFSHPLNLFFSLWNYKKKEFSINTNFLQKKAIFFKLDKILLAWRILDPVQKD